MSLRYILQNRYLCNFCSIPSILFEAYYARALTTDCFNDHTYQQILDKKINITVKPQIPKCVIKSNSSRIIYIAPATGRPQVHQIISLSGIHCAVF